MKLVSQTYLEQLFMKLRKASLVKAVRGASGGFSLNSHPKNIRIHDIMEAVDENFAAVSIKIKSNKKPNQNLLSWF